MKVENLFLRKKRQKAWEKKLSCKFVRINSSNAKKGYDTDYEVSKIQTFISKFEEKKEENKTKQKRTRRRNKRLRLQLTH